MLYYCPLENYPERYTMQWSAPKTGWLERNWIKAGIPYERIDSRDNEKGNDRIKTGLVLDMERRTSHCFSQVEQLIYKAVSHLITDDDIIYFDDFWHLGIEALPYTFHQLGITPKMYAFCHAQSVDEFDFTYPMRHWMRDFEKGIGKILSGVFVNSNLLKQLLIEVGVGTEETVHVIGHIFCEEEVRERYPNELPPKENTVIFSSRWDDEKNPLFFLEVVEKVMQKRQDIKFIICTSQEQLRTNNPANLKGLQKVMKQYPNNLFLKEGLSKEEYYMELLKAKIQINTASQDWISIALLEASVAGCYPLYPYYRSFPQAFRNEAKYMYYLFVPKAAEAAAHKISKIIDTPEWWDKNQIEARAWIHRRHNLSWARMINIMMGENTVEAEPYE